MEWIRGKGQGKNQLNYLRETSQAQPSPDEEGPWKTVGNPVATLEADNRYVDISNLDKHFPKLTNKFSVLSETEVDYETEVNYEEPMKVVPNSMWGS